MARPLRVNLEGGWYHVFARALDRLVVFRDERDRAHLLELFAASLDRYRLEIHAFVLMDTHWHAVLRTPDANLSQAMQWLNLSYAAWFNTRHQRRGTVFQRPFGSVPVENSAWAYELSLYVHLNPLRIKALGLSKREREAANLGMRQTPSEEVLSARLKTLREYPWSSYRAYAGYVSPPEWLQCDELWRRASRKNTDRVKRYRKDAQARACEGGDPKRQEVLLDSLAIGSAEFIRRVKGMGSQLGVNRETAGKRRLRERVNIQQVIEAVSTVRGEHWSGFGNRWGDSGAALVMWIARQCTGLTLGEIGETVGGRDYAAVAMAIRRVGTRLSKDVSLKKQASKACELLNVKMSPQ